MTSDATAVVSGTEDPAEKKWWAVHTIGGREIHFNAPTPEQLMVLRRLARQLNIDGQNPGHYLVGMAKVLDAVSACMSSDQERDFVDQLVLDRKIDIDELAPLIRAALAGPGAAKPEPKKRVRRR